MSWGNQCIIETFFSNEKIEYLKLVQVLPMGFFFSIQYFIMYFVEKYAPHYNESGKKSEIKI